MAFLGRFKSGSAAKKLDVKAQFDVLGDPHPGRKSTVYRVRDRNTREEFALKILDAKKTAEYEARFKGMDKPTEGEIASKFDHRFICKTIQFGKTSEGSPYLLLELLGASLKYIIGIGEKVLAGRRLKYLRQAGEALETVHKTGFIHRDISPRNFLFTEDGEVLKLTDFGYAVPATGRFLEPGNRTGTPEYMAPELIRLHRTDHRLDVFAFGIVAYEMFAFKHPWGHSVTGAVWHANPPTDIREYRPEIEPHLAELIMSTIQPDVTKRCPSMGQFLNALRRVEKETV
ncbi:MAG: serine/threonine protein kinase [Pirellulales bacterium]|nr:serine/threonine protein kinase [Pirellulales bacterium]